MKINNRNVFFALVALLFLTILFITPDFGISGDEITQRNYGNSVFKYFSSFGSDKDAITGEYTLKKDLQYYGGFFDGFASLLNNIFKPKDEFVLRHYWNAIFGLIGILFAGLVAKEITGKWYSACIAVILLALTPRFFGESFNNPKDVPFATSQIIGVYALIRWLKHSEALTWKRTIVLGLAIALGLSVRIGGLLLVAEFGLFFAWRIWTTKSWKQQPLFRRQAIHFIVAVIIGYFGGCLFWPYALEAPFSHPFEALKIMTSYPTSIRMLFDGEHVYSTSLPWIYAPKSFLVMTPLVIIIAFIGSLYLLVTKKGRVRYPYLWIVLFMAIFPVCYVIYKESALYDGIRHMLFVYPPMIVAAAVFCTWLYEQFAAKPAVKWVLVGVLALGLLSPLRFCLANHPNEYVYFNELTGGINGAYGNYETDYYMNSIKEATYKLAKMKDLYHTKDSIIIASNCILPLQQYLTQINPRLKSEYVRYRERYNKDWEYGIFYSRFIEKEFLQNGYFPPGHTIDIIKADTVPLAVIVQRDPERNDLKAFKATEAKNYPEAVAYYAKALAFDPNNETAYDNYAIALASTGQIDKAIEVMNHLVKMNPSDAQAYSLLSQLYQAKGDAQNAQNARNTANNLMMEEAEKAGQENQ